MTCTSSTDLHLSAKQRGCQLYSALRNPLNDIIFERKPPNFTFLDCHLDWSPRSLLEYPLVPFSPPRLLPSHSHVFTPPSLTSTLLLSTTPQTVSCPFYSSLQGPLGRVHGRMSDRPTGDHCSFPPSYTLTLNATVTSLLHPRHIATPSQTQKYHLTVISPFLLVFVSRMP